MYVDLTNQKKKKKKQSKKKKVCQETDWQSLLFMRPNYFH